MVKVFDRNSRTHAALLRQIENHSDTISETPIKVNHSTTFWQYEFDTFLCLINSRIPIDVRFHRLAKKAKFEAN